MRKLLPDYRIGILFLIFGTLTAISYYAYDTWKQSEERPTSWLIALFYTLLSLLVLLVLYSFSSPGFLFLRINKILFISILLLTIFYSIPITRWDLVKNKSAENWLLSGFILTAIFTSGIFIFMILDSLGVGGDTQSSYSLSKKIYRDAETKDYYKFYKENQGHKEDYDELMKLLNIQENNIQSSVDKEFNSKYKPYMEKVEINDEGEIIKYYKPLPNHTSKVKDMIKNLKKEVQNNAKTKQKELDKELESATEFIKKNQKLLVDRKKEEIKKETDPDKIAEKANELKRYREDAELINKNLNGIRGNLERVDDNLQVGVKTDFRFERWKDKTKGIPGLTNTPPLGGTVNLGTGGSTSSPLISKEKLKAIRERNKSNPMLSPTKMNLLHKYNLI